MKISYPALLACILLLSVPAVNAASAGVNSQQAALYYSGLDAPVAARKLFQKQTQRAWLNYEKQVGQPLLSWSGKEIAYAGGTTIFYPFSGPDFLTVERAFPNAARYVLVAQQKALKPINPENMSEKKRAAFEKKLSDAWAKFGILGYFRTEDLNDDQRDKTSNLGVTTILMAFAARLGYEVTEVAPLGFNLDKGEWEALSASEAKWNSVRLSLQKEGRKVTLDYLSVDLSDDGMRTKKEQQAWMKRMASHPTLLKAASHLLQEPYFSILRNMLVSSAPIVVQDETGLNYTDLSKIGAVKLYGNFIKPQVLFKKTRQTALAAAYKAEKTRNELPFAFSYLKQAETRSIQIARRAIPPQKPEQAAVQTPLGAKK